jgi:hypothetical protein
MLKTMLAAAALVAAAGAATAQAPPMDMSWAMQSQMRNQAMGDAAARNAAMAYYNYMRRLRARGYRGPSLATGVTSDSLRRSVQGANDASQAYIHGAQINSGRTGAAIHDHDMRAVRGCYYGRDWRGNLAYVCP